RVGERTRRRPSMIGRMGAGPGLPTLKGLSQRLTDREGVVPNPGLPPERVRLLLDHLATGLRPYLAARAAGVSVTFAYGLHHKMGGVYRPPGVTYSDRYLDREERYELARL